MTSLEYANILEETVIENLGEHETLVNLLAALSVDERIENLEFIARMCDLPYGNELTEI